MTQLASTKPTKFTDVPPGSLVRIIDTKNPLHPVEATVIDVLPEAGPGRIPAIVYVARGEETTRTVTASGRYSVEVITSAEILRELMPANLEVIRARTRPQEVEAVRFDGTTDSATGCMALAAGVGAIRFDQNSQPPSLTLLRTGETVRPGQYLLVGREQKTLSVASGDDFATEYEVLS